jgi:hypothetical protein
MKRIFFTLTGTNHYYGTDFLKKGMKIRLKKEPLKFGSKIGSNPVMARV